jgi:hypothetical protein
MSERKVSYPTEKYGPVTVELRACEECRTEVQEQHMVGWFQLSPIGISVAILGLDPNPLDFCSLACLASAVKQMTGE